MECAIAERGRVPHQGQSKRIAAGVAALQDMGYSVAEAIAAFAVRAAGVWTTKVVAPAVLKLMDVQS